MTEKLAIPTVHLNGTSRQELLDQLHGARSAVLTANKILSNAWPHGRDYYTQGPEAYGNARDQHETRMRKLNEVAGELEAIAIGVYDQGRKS